VNSRLPAAQRRTQILDVALRTFAARGFHDASMNDIALAAGVTKPVLYQHFASKRELYLSLIDEVPASMLPAVSKAPADATDGRAQTEAGVVAYFKWVDSNRESFVLLFGSGARNDEEFATAVRKVERQVAEAIAPLIDAGIDAEHQRLLAYALVGMSESVSRQLVMSGNAFDPHLVGCRLAAFAWAGLRNVGP